MIRILVLFLAVMFFSCSSQPAPAWQQESFVNMNSFIKSFMEGNGKFAGNYYDRLIENLKMTTDPDEIIKGHLIKCSLDYSLMNYRTCTEAKPLLSVIKKEENKVYYNFISSENGKKNIPQKYKDIAKNIENCNTEKINRSIRQIDEPLSKLIASSFAVKNNCYDEKLLLSAIETASKEGWRIASEKYIEFTVLFYENNGKENEAEKLMLRIKLLKKENM